MNPALNRPNLTNQEENDNDSEKSDGVYRMAGKVSKYWLCGTQIDRMITMSPIGTAEHHKEWAKLALAI